MTGNKLLKRKGALLTAPVLRGRERDLFPSVFWRKSAELSGFQGALAHLPQHTPTDQWEQPAAFKCQKPPIKQSADFRKRHQA